MPEKDVVSFSQDLLAWYDHNARVLPWRLPPGSDGFPPAYQVWLSEIMLQQTTVIAVQPYFLKFLARWPVVTDLAAAPLDEVLANWAGLGYYARARNLHRCARVVVSEYGGLFPDSENELLRLPGIGPYTAAAVAAIAFGQRAVVVDGNVERVMSRFHAVEEPLPKARKAIRLYADEKTPQARAGDYAQALMDLGATLCHPKKPVCLLCPVRAGCQAEKNGTVLCYPRKEKKKPRPTRQARAYVVVSRGAVFLRRRDGEGLLGGMTEVPTGPWEEAKLMPDPVFEQSGPWVRLKAVVCHSFTHFNLEISLSLRVLPDQNARAAFEAQHATESSLWARPEDCDRLSLPTLMRKILEAVAQARGIFPDETASG